VENLETLTIPARFNGPPSSANGGYACGVVAALLGGHAEVTLRTPPPLDTLLLVTGEDGAVRVAHGETLVAEAEAVELELEVPEPVALDEAREASRGYPGFEAHAYSTCYVCGPKREDGLGIFPGPVPGRELVAAPWTPPPQGVSPEIVWAALDCPSGWAIDTFGREGVLLGRLSVRILEPPPGGVPLVVLGWPLAAEGRKRAAGSALVGADGRTLAYARSTWIVPRPA
jgi:hypothetical protein